MRVIKNKHGVYEFVKTEEEKNLENIQMDLGTILIERAMDKMLVRELQSSQADLLMEITLLKSGGNA